VNCVQTGSCKKSLGQSAWKAICGRVGSAWLTTVALLLCVLPAAGQSQTQSQSKGQSPQSPSQQTVNVQAAATQSQGQAPGQESPGTISGTVVDQMGAVVPGAHVTLTRQDPPLSQEVTSDSDGQFFFANIMPGPFRLTITSQGFTAQTFSGMLHSGEDYTVPPVALTVASAASEVKVLLTPVEVAEAEIKDEERQRVLGVIPNFYVTYNPAAVPLNPRQKFELAWKLTVDPVNFGVTAAIAGIQQGVNAYSGYGQGAQGYGKRLGAAYADSVTSTFIGGAILPSLFKQDPRFFYKGTGSRRARFFYAMANAVICKGDNGRWQANYSSMLGNLAAGGISNLYYPESDRDVTVTLENTLIGIGASAANNLLQEFVIRKLTRNPPTYSQANP